MRERWEINSTSEWDGAVALAAEGWEPYAVTETLLGRTTVPVYYFRRRVEPAPKAVSG